MLIPVTLRNLQPSSHIGPTIYGTDSARNGYAQLPIYGHDSGGSSAWIQSPHPVEVHAECNSSRRLIPGQVAPNNPYLHTNAEVGRHLAKADQLRSDPRSPLTKQHHAAVPRLRLTTAGFHSRRRGGFVSSHFFPRSVGLGPTASCANGALTIAPSMLCQRQTIPSISSYSASPLRQSFVNTPWRFHSKKYLWIELALPNSLLGKAFHWHPVRNAKTIPSKTLRGSMALRPPPACRRYFRFLARFRCGISGSTRFHSSADTAHDMIAPMPIFIMSGLFEAIFIYG
jgi:hypothetical protein